MAAFDFSTPGALPTGATLVRASAGSYFNNAGILQSAAANAARFDFNPTNLAYRGLLIEPAATSLARYSEDVSNTIWNMASIGTTIATNAYAAPDGQMTADKVQETAVADEHRFWYQDTSLYPAAGTAYSMSLFFRAAGRTSLYFVGPAGASQASVIDLTAKTSSNPAVRLAEISGGWFRVDCSWVGTGAQFYFYARCMASGALGYVGDVTKGISPWGLQVEAGAQPSSYIRTTTANATRAGDGLTLDWGSKGVADGVIKARYTFDDATTQIVSTTVAGGTSVVPTNLNRPWLRRVEEVLEAITPTSRIMTFTEVGARFLTD